MKLIKNIFKSIFILLGIGVLASGFIFAIMMVTGASIFGYKYVNFSGKYTTVFDDVSFTKLVVETDTAGFDIVYSKDMSKVEIHFNALEKGIYKEENFVDSAFIGNADAQELSEVMSPINYSATIADGVLTIKTTEPRGLSFSSDNKFKIWLPSSVHLNSMDIKTNTSASSLTDEAITLSDLSIEHNRKLANYVVSDLITVNNNFSLKTNSGRYYVNATINGNVEIDSNFATTVFTKSVGNIGSTIKVNGDNPSVEFGAEKTSSTAENLVNINSDLLVECKKGGLIKIVGSLNGTISLISPNVNLIAKKIVGKVAATDGFASVTVGELEGDSTITKKNGTLNIEQFNGGNLTIIGSNSKVYIGTISSGNVNISNDYGEVEVGKCEATSLQVKTVNGSISAKNISNTQVVLKSEKGTIDAEFLNISGTNEIETKKSVNVKIKDNCIFNLTTASISGGVNVSLGGVNYNNWDGCEIDGNYKTKLSYVNSSSSSSNNLVVKTDDGNINIGLK